MAYKDWMPGRRDEIMTLAKTWIMNLPSSGGAWTVSQDEIDELAVLVETAQETLNDAAKNKGDEVLNARVREAFAALTRYMRLMRERKFFTPPMTEGDWLKLGMRPRDRIPTPVPPPTAQVEGNLAFPGIGLVEIVKIQMTGGKIDRRADYGVRIYYGLLGKSAVHDNFRLTEPPATGNDLPHSVFTRRRSHLFDFTGNSGCAVFFCMRYENSKGEAGPWGPVLEAHIP
ncbi:MAG: DUF883 domain-containing protein [Treponema sp.]|jgi:hypothetical protein|nr:DUF883 domain-containing protein [Treponema sp.]